MTTTDTTAQSTSTAEAAEVPAQRASTVELVQDVATRVGVELGAELGKEVRESALLLGMALVVVGLSSALASTALLIG